MHARAAALRDGRCKPMLPLPHCSGARRTGVCVSAPPGWGPRSCADRQEVSTTYLVGALTNCEGSERGVPSRTMEAPGRPRITPRGSLSGRNGHPATTTITTHSPPPSLRFPHCIPPPRWRPIPLRPTDTTTRRLPFPSTPTAPIAFLVSPSIDRNPPPKTLLLPAPHLLLCRTTRLRPEAIILTVYIPSASIIAARPSTSHLKSMPRRQPPPSSPIAARATVHLH